MGGEYKLSSMGIGLGVLKDLDQSGREPGVQTCVNLIEQKNPPVLERTKRRTYQTEPRLRSDGFVLHVESNRFTLSAVNETKAMTRSRRAPWLFFGYHEMIDSGVSEAQQIHSQALVCDGRSLFEGVEEPRLSCSGCLQEQAGRGVEYPASDAAKTIEPPSPEPEDTHPRYGLPNTPEVRITYPPSGGERQRRRSQQFPYSPGSVEASAEVDLALMASEEISPPLLWVTVKALEQHGRVVHFKPVCIPNAIDYEIQIELRCRGRPGAEPVSIARNVILPASKRRGNGHRQPRQGVQNVGLARRVGSVDSGDGQNALRQAVEPSRRRPVLVDGDHRQFHRLQNRAVVGDPESQ